MSYRTVLTLLAVLTVAMLTSQRLPMAAAERGRKNVCNTELNTILRDIRDAIAQESCATEEEYEARRQQAIVNTDSVLTEILRHQDELLTTVLEQSKSITQTLVTLDEGSQSQKQDIRTLRNMFEDHRKSWMTSQEEIKSLQSEMHIVKEEMKVSRKDVESVAVQVQDIVLSAEASSESVEEDIHAQGERMSTLAEVLKTLQLEMTYLRESIEEQAEDIKTLKMRGGGRRPGPRGLATGGGGGRGGGGEGTETEGGAEEEGTGGETEPRPAGRPGRGRRRRPGGRRRLSGGINERSLGPVLPEDCVHPFMGVADGCFAVYTNMRLSWENAKEHCGRMQGDLAHPSNLPDFLFYLSEAFPGGWVFWVGGERFNPLQTWKWTDGDLIDAPHDFWGRGEPSQNPGADCMYLHSYWGYRAGADPCEEEKYFICQQPRRQHMLPFRGPDHAGSSNSTA